MGTWTVSERAFLTGSSQLVSLSPNGSITMNTWSATKGIWANTGYIPTAITNVPTDNQTFSGASIDGLGIVTAVGKVWLPTGGS